MTKVRIRRKVEKYFERAGKIACEVVLVSDAHRQLSKK